MPTEVGVWLDEPLARSRPEVSYVRKSTKFVKCRNEYAHMPRSRMKRAVTGVRELRQDLFAEWVAKTQSQRMAANQVADTLTLTTSVKARFHKLASDWSSEVSSVSSVGALTSHPKYREIINLGWPVVPLLLADLQRNRGYWFTALAEITGIRPFDPSTAGNSKRMSEAWIKWGQRKGLI